MPKPNWDAMLDVGNPCNDDDEEILCETCGQQVDEDTTCVSSWCIEAPSHKQYSWSELSEAYIELLDERDTLKRKLKYAENNRDHLMFLLRFRTEFESKERFSHISQKLFWEFYVRVEKEDFPRNMEDMANYSWNTAWALAQEEERNAKKKAK